MRSRSVLRAVGCVLVLAVGSCGGPAPDVDVDPPAVPQRDGAVRDQPSPGPQDPAEPPTPSDAEPHPDPPAETSQGAGDPPPVPAQASDAGPVGQNARVYLQATQPRLVVEVNAVSGRGSPGSLDHLLAKLGEVTDKPSGIERAGTQIPATRDRYSVDDLRALEREYRRTSSSGEAASVHILFLNGSFAPDRNVLGIAYSASSFAIFSDRIREVATPLVGAARIERSVVLHETGHLLGLINIGFRSPREREHPEHRHHSTNPRSVMYWAVETSLVVTVLDGPPPDDFDADDRADLEDLKAGRL